MRLHTVFVSYRRPALTVQTVESYLATVSIPFTAVIVDNGSPVEEIGQLRHLGVRIVELGENKYPGYATNRGFELAPVDASLLQRSDNDTLYLPGWCDEMVEAFQDANVGQFGLIAEGDEEYAANPNWPVGGNSVISRKIWDEGLRYTEVPWPQLSIIEEHQLTLDVWKRGYQRVFGTRPGMGYLDDHDEEYHRQSHADRGLVL